MAYKAEEFWFNSLKEQKIFLSSIRQTWLRSPHSSLFSEKGGRFPEGEAPMALS
jgi:hypothetical protein